MISDKESGGESYVRVQQQQSRDGSRVMSYELLAALRRQLWRGRRRSERSGDDGW